MQNELIDVARTLASRGWLPGIEWSDSLRLLLIEHFEYSAEESDLHLAAHNEIRRREFTVKIDHRDTIIHCRQVIVWKRVPGTDTLALLRCLCRACEASER